MPDQDGYPTPSELRKVKKWSSDPHFDFMALMEFVRSIWWCSDWGFTRNGRTFRVSTGGWSGNEQIITALESNWIFWSLCWVSSKRGGHYVFKIPKPGVEKP